MRSFTFKSSWRPTSTAKNSTLNFFLTDNNSTFVLGGIHSCAKNVISHKHPAAISYELSLSHLGRDVGQIFPTASLHRDHLILYALVCEKNRIHHCCSVGTEKSQHEGPVGNEACRVSHWTVDLGVGIFLEPLNTNDRFFFSYTNLSDRTVQYSIISVGDVTEVYD